MSKEIATIIEGAREQFAEIAASTPTSVPLNFAREANFAAQILATNDFSAQIAMRSPESLVAAVAQVAAVGLSLNPVSKHAYLVPRKNRNGFGICLDVGSQGYVELARRAGVKDIYFGLVRVGDDFVFPSPGEKVRHHFDPFAPRGELRGAYAQHVNPDGSFGQCVALSADEIRKRMESSDGWKAHHRTQKASSCIWCQWPDEMALKTVLRYARRWWPQTPELDRAVNVIAAHDEDHEDDGAIETTGEWVPQTEAIGAPEDPAKPVTADPETLATIRQEIAEACPDLDQQTGEPKLLATLLTAYRIKSLPDLLAADAKQCRERIAKYHANRMARDIAKKGGEA